MSTQKDEPMLVQPSRVLDMERKAIEAYRAKHPDGPLWQELAFETRLMWLEFVEGQE
jgi:hypothetical protein